MAREVRRRLGVRRRWPGCATLRLCPLAFGDQPGGRRRRLDAAPYAVVAVELRPSSAGEQRPHRLSLAVLGHVERALLEVEHQLRYRPIDLLLQAFHGRVAVLVRVPVQERDILRGHLDEPRPGLGQAAGEEATEAEAAGVVLLEAVLRLSSEVEGIAVLR